MRNYRKCEDLVQWVVMHHNDIPDQYGDRTVLEILEKEVLRFNINNGTKFESLYHYVVLPSGRVKKFEDIGYYLPHGGLNSGEAEVTNDNSVSIALSGKLSEREPKEIVLDVAANEAAYLIKQYRLKGVTYHRRLLEQIGSYTECPGLKFPFKKFEKMVREKMEVTEEKKEEVIEMLPWWTELKDWAIKGGIVTGDEFGNINMEKKVTMAEVLAIIYKFNNYLKGGK